MLENQMDYIIHTIHTYTWSVILTNDHNIVWHKIIISSQTLKNWNFWILLMMWGVGAGLFNALLTLLPQILCPFGYSDVSLLITLNNHTLFPC